LQFSGELMAMAGNGCQIIVGQLAPFFFDFALKLFPVSLDWANDVPPK
jgi:hypothetical protein